MLRDHQRIPGVGEMHIAMSRIAGRILLLDRPERVPGADIGPSGVEAQHHRLDRAGFGADALHHRVVDRVGRAFGEALRVHTQEGAILAALAIGALAGRENVAAESSYRVQPYRGTYGEDAAVPQGALARQVLACALDIRLLEESLDARGAALAERPADANGAVAGLRRRRRPAEGDDVALSRERGAALDGVLEGGALGDDMVRRHGEQHGIVASDHMHGGEGQRRRRAASFRLEEDGARLRANARELRLRHETVSFVADEKRLAESGDTAQAQRRLLQQRALAV